MPAVYLGARVSSKAPDFVIRPALVVVLGISALKLLGASNTVLIGVLVGSLAVVVTAVVRKRPRSASPGHGLVPVPVGVGQGDA